jgi:hypothetical protein
MRKPVTLERMDELFAQIRAASTAGLYYLALVGTLVLPDICGALDSDDGRASGAKYRSWIEKNVPQQAENAGLIYGLRCSLLHQGRAMPRGGPFRIAFMAPTAGIQLHGIVTSVDDDEVGWLSIPDFVEEIAAGAEQWLARVGNTKRVQTNLTNFARLRPEGLLPHVAGPVIA